MLFYQIYPQVLTVVPFFYFDHMLKSLRIQGLVIIICRASENQSAPKELEPADRRSSVHVNLIRRDEECPEPEKRHTPFQGVGRTLGSSSASEPVPEADVSSSLNTARSPSMCMVADKSLPSTLIQLRLADGLEGLGLIICRRLQGRIQTTWVWGSQL